MPKKIPIYDSWPEHGRHRIDSTLALANSDPLLIRRGLVEGAIVVHKFGLNPDIPNGAWGGVLQATTQFTWQTAATTVRIKAGGNAADDGTSSPLGAGAQTVTIQGLDINGAAVSETIITAGAGASASTVTEYFRVHRAFVETAGVYTGNNTADIVIEDTAGTVDLIMIAADEGQSQFCAYTIPSGKVGLLASVVVQASVTKPADFRLFARADANDVTNAFSPKKLKIYWSGQQGGDHHRLLTPHLVMPEWTDRWVEARGSSVNTAAVSSMEILLYDA